MLPAKRESRRMLGEYVISQKDISNGVIFNDTVAFGGWPLDDHFPAGYYHKGTPNTYIRTPAPYPIPYRALYSRNVDNLFFAGRNISMTHMAMSSMRVMATCAILGEAVGCAAAMAAKYGIPPHGVYLDRIGELQEMLMCADCFLPYFKRRISEICLTAEILGADGSIRSGEDRANNIYGTENKGVAVKCGDSIGYKLGAYERINSVHIVFDSDLDRETLPGDGCERTHVTRANVLLNSPVMHMPTTLVRSFSLKALTENGEITLLSVDNNLKRSYHVEIPEGITISELTLAVLRGWGEKEARLISFDFN